MKIMIIENEPLPAEQLKDYISNIRKDCQILPVVSTVREASSLLNAITPDLIFMDIELSDGTAFDLFRQTKIKSPVVFTTAYHQYITNAFDNNGIAYLLKPIKQEMVKNAFQNLERNREMFYSPGGHSSKIIEGMVTGKTYKSQFLVKQGQKLIPLKTSDINHFYCDGGLVCLITKDKRKFVTDETLSELEILLNPDDFFRMNRKYLVAKDAVLSLDNYSRGQVSVKINLQDADKIIVSRQQTRLLKSWLNH